jgi:hypothetical protein
VGAQPRWGLMSGNFFKGRIRPRMELAIPQIKLLTSIWAFWMVPYAQLLTETNVRLACPNETPCSDGFAAVSVASWRAPVRTEAFQAVGDGLLPRPA